MLKALFWGVLAIFVITLIVEYWVWVLLILALLIGGYAYCRKKGLVKSLKKAAPEALSEKRTLTEETFHAVGVTYYENNIHQLARLNPEWKKTTATIIKEGKAGKRIFKNNYINRPVELIAEPGNPHDPNAVAVHFAGKLVGYISREENQRVRAILEGREIVSISGFIGGGAYKIVKENGETFSDVKGFSVSIRINYI